MIPFALPMRQREPVVTIALFKIFKRRPEAEEAREAQAITNLNMRMQRMLALHAQANTEPQALPQVRKAC
jgi:hypothetical protein